MSNSIVPWRAHWIWCDGEPQPRNFYLHLRKTFELPIKARSARVLVSADSCYQLFVNGKFVNRGPARCDRRWQSYDEWDITKYLRTGKNAIAALVHHYGEWTFSYMLGRGGFLCQAEIALTNGETLQLQTDDTWKVMPAAAWERQTPRLSIQLGFSEVYDARQAPEGWTLAKFDDSTWQNAVLIGKPPCEPWPQLVPRDIPAMRETLVYPEKVLEVGTLGKQLQLYDFLHRLNFTRLFNDSGFAVARAVAYAVTYVWSPQENELEIHAGTDDPLKLWINDRLVLSHLAARKFREMAAKMKLRAGWNKLLAKSIQQDGEWRLQIYFTGEAQQELKWAASPQLEANQDAPWMVIGPFPCDDASAGFDAIYSPEKEIDYTQQYRDKNGGEISWKSAGHTREMIPVSVQMLHAEHLPSDKTKIKNIAGLIQPRGKPAVIGSNENGIYAVIDFGKEVTGYPRLQIKAASGGEIVDLGYGEVLQGFDGAALPPASNKAGVVNPDRDHVHYADRYICKSGAQEFQTFDKRAFRYLEIQIRGVRQPLQIGPISLVFSTFPVEPRGSFKCSDRRLNKIWEIGKYTVQLNMEDGYTDCPWRERGQWWGDVRIEALCNYYAFGDLRLIRRALQLQAQSQNEEGIIWGVYPTDWQGAKLPTFTLIWILTLWDYYLFSGDAALVKELFSIVQKALQFFEKYLDEHYLLNEVPYWNFVDWAKVETRGESTAVNCLYYRGLICAALFAETMGDQANVTRYNTIAEHVKQAINARLWNAERHVYHDARLNGELIDQVGQQANSLAIGFEIAPKEKWQKILDYIHAPAENVSQAGSPYFSFYVLAAMYKAGRHQQALQYIHERWGKMLDWGATTWWEMWQPRASFCHGWSAAPTHDLPAEFLGVKPVAPGWSEIEIKPHPANLTWAKGRVPTLKGNVGVELRITKATFAMTVEIPTGCTAYIFVPRIGKAGTKVNGQSKKLPAGVARLGEENRYIKFAIKRGGKYEFVVE
jgi:alpha-L-rhamnosidase